VKASNDRFSVEGRVAVVTGGGTGIGRATALALAEYGADVVLSARRPEPLETTAKEVEALGRRALVLPADVVKPDDCQRIVDTTLAEFGRLDILVNNAGGAKTQSIRKWTDDEWQQVLALNLGSAFFLSRAAAEPMLAQGKGTIVNISSGASLVGMPQAAPYGAAKAGLNNLTASMAAAWTRKGIRVNCVVVGGVRAASLLDDLARSGIDSDLIGQTNGVGRLGEPDEIANAVLFFASDAASYCSGQSLYVHGGPGPAGI
jgi:NAD(P)-dependent dehydrogenase (short-subunit alcohol dehydrogenase family)